MPPIPSDALIPCLITGTNPPCLGITRKSQKRSRHHVLFPLLTLLLFAGCSSGGGTGGPNQPVPNTGIGAGIEIKGPIVIPPAILAGEPTSVTISVFVPGSHVELSRVNGDSILKIGEMLDDGTSSDQTAGDHIYSIQTTIEESAADNIALRISATDGEKSGTIDISIPVAQIPTLMTDEDMNRAADELYQTALVTRDYFSGVADRPFTVFDDIGNNLLRMFGDFEAITQQDIGVFSLFRTANKVLSCSQLLSLLKDNPSDSRLTQFKRSLAEATGLSEQDFSDPLWKDAPFSQAKNYLLLNPINPASGCEGMQLQDVQSFAIKSEIGQFTSLAGEGLAKHFEMGSLATTAVKEGVGTLVGWFADSQGKGHVVVGRTPNGATFDAPVGTHNLHYAFTDGPKAVVKNIAVAPQQTTTVSFVPGTVTGGYSVLGRVITSSGVGLAGIDLKLSGFEVATATTDITGNYAFRNLANGLYTIVPLSSLYSFNPIVREITVDNVDLVPDVFVAHVGVQISTWANAYTGGASTFGDISIKETGDRGFILAAGYLTKIDGDGNVVWSNKYSHCSSTGSECVAAIVDVEQTSDGGYIAVGTDSGGFGNIGFLLKLSPTGTVEWTKRYCCYAQNIYRDIRQTIDGGYIVAGRINTSPWIMKVDSQGDIQWENTYGSEWNLAGFSIVETSDMNYVLAGGCCGSGGLVIKLDPGGSMIWQRKFLVPSPGYSTSPSINGLVETPDGNFVVAGSYDPYGGDADYRPELFIMALSNEGEILWQSRIHVDTEVVLATGLDSTFDGGYIVSAAIGPERSSKDIMILKFNGGGDLVWRKTYGSADADESVRRIRRTRDGAYVFAGVIYSPPPFRLFVAKIGEGGELRPSCQFSELSNTVTPSISNLVGQQRDGSPLALSTTTESRIFTLTSVADQSSVTDLCGP